MLSPNCDSRLFQKLRNNENAHCRATRNVLYSFRLEFKLSEGFTTCLFGCKTKWISRPRCKISITRDKGQSACCQVTKGNASLIGHCIFKLKRHRLPPVRTQQRLRHRRQFKIQKHEYPFGFQSGIPCYIEARKIQSYSYLE